MAVFVESIKPVSGQSFRLLNWDQSVERVQLHLDSSSFREVVGRGSRWHRHQELELTIVTKGSGIHLVGDRLTRFSDGEVVLIGRSLPHYWRMESTSAGFCIQFDPEVPGSAWKSPELQQLNVLWERAKRGLRFDRKLALEVQAASTELPNLSPLLRLSRLIEILVQISVASEECARPIASAHFHLPEPGEPYGDSIAMVVNLITTRYADDLRLETILEKLPMSRATFARHFKASTGKTFSNFLTEVRMDHACHALAKSARPVTDIAYESGFNDLSHFHRLFRQRTDGTPLDWRRKQKPSGEV